MGHGLAETFGAGVSSGVEAGLKQVQQGQRDKRLEAIRVRKAKQKRNMQMAKELGFSITYQEPETIDGKKLAFTDPINVKRRFDLIMTALVSANGGEPIGPAAKHLANFWANQSLQLAESLRKTFIDMGLEGEFNPVTLVNLAGKNQPPGAFTAYMKQVIDKHKEKLEKDKLLKLQKQAANLSPKVGPGTRPLEEQRTISALDLAREAGDISSEKILGGRAASKQSLRIGQAQADRAVRKEGRDIAKDEAAELEAELKEVNRILNRQAATTTETRLETAAGREAFLKSPEGILQTKVAEARAKNEIFLDSRVSVADKRFLGLLGETELTQRGMRARNINVPLDKKVRSELLAKEGALRTVHSTIVNIIKRVEGFPERLRAPGAVAAFLTSMQRGTVGFINLIPGLRDFVVPDSAVRLLNEADWLNNLGETAKQNAIIKSLVVGLTYQAGAIAGQTAKAFSDKDYENISRQLGAGTANDKVMVGVLRSFALVQSEVFAIDFFTKTGVKKYIGVPDVNRDDPFGGLSLEQMSGVIKEILPRELYNQYKDALSRLAP